MRRVLVTGATGCIGRHAVRALLQRGWEVHAASLHQTPSPVRGVTWHRADLLNTTDVASLLRRSEPTHLLHLAWSITPGRWAHSLENFAWVRASLDLYQRFREQGGVRAVSAGSCLEYDWNYGYCSESLTPCVPHTAYGVSKHALQMLTSAFAAGAGFSSAWARIFFLYGPHEHPDRLVASVVRSLLSDEVALCSHGNQTRDYLFAQDVADALVALLESDMTGAVNIASGRPIALRDLVLRIGALLGKTELIELGAIPQAPTDKPLVVADVRRLSQELGWQPRYELDDGLLRTVAWWREHLNAAQALGSR